MSLSFDKVFGVHQYTIKVRNDRAQVIASNLANADTPGYKARDVDFNTALVQQSNFKFEDNNPPMVKTSERHLDISDLDNDDKRTFKNEDKSYVFTSSVNYPNNRDLVKQKVTFNDKLELNEVIVLDSDDVPNMTLKVKDIDFSPSFKNNYFDLEEIMSTVNLGEEVIETSAIDEVIYPLALPDGTKLANEEKVDMTDGERVILTFTGDKPFLLVEETVKAMDEFTVIPTMGEPVMFMDSLGVLSDNSVNFTSGGINYYLVSEVMNQDELLEVANSINVLPTMK